MKFSFVIIFLLFYCLFCKAQNLSVDTSYMHGNVWSINYRNNGRLYKVISFNEDKTKYSECDYKGEQINGICKWFYPSGKVKASCMIINNKREGEYLHFFESGNVEIKYQFKNGLRNGPCTSYYESGEKSSECNYIKGEIDGRKNYFSKAGNKYLVENYKNGKMDGAVTYYYNNGQIQYEGEYKNGRMYGERFAYDEKGNLLNGKNSMHFGDNNYYRECIFINGKPEGEMKVYSDSSLLLLANFKNGKPDGLTHFYNRNNKDSLIDVYKNGKFIKEIQFNKSN